MKKDTLFREITVRCGLAAMIAPGAVRRALQQVGSDSDTATASDYLSALPILHKRLRVYLQPHDADLRIEEMRQFLLNLIRGIPERTTPPQSNHR